MNRENAICRACGAVCWLIFAVVVICPPAGAQQDINVVGGTNPYIILGRGMQWGGSGFGNIGNNFIFTPTSPDEGFCLFVTNNNPSSSHTFTVTVRQTGDPAVNQFQSLQQKWSTVPTNASFPQTVNPSSVVGINYKTTASANIVVSFSGNAAAGGSPDTADVFAVQTTQSSCGALAANSVQGVFQQNNSVPLANQFPVLIGGLSNPGFTSTAEVMHIGTSGQGLLSDGGVCCQAFASGFVTPGNISSTTFSNSKAANGTATEGEIVLDVFNLGSVGTKGWAAGFVRTNFLEAATDQQFLTQSNQPAFTVLGRVVNPGANGTILHNFNKVNSTVNPAYKTLVLGCSAACEVAVNRTSAQGTTCTALNIQNMQLGNGGTVLAPAATDVAENACATQPTVTFQIYDLFLSAGQSFSLDLSGFVNFHANTTGGGLSVTTPASITGTVSAVLTFMEQ